MRRWLVGGYLVAACEGRGANALSDARSDAAHDARVIDRYCPGLTQIAFTAMNAYDVASDGTSLFLSVQATFGTFELQTIPLAGGASTTLATTSVGKFILAAFGDSVFYAVPQSASLYDLHQRTGVTDATLASVTSTVPVVLAANATDLYVGGSDIANTASVWRVSRSGSGTPSLVTSLAASYPQTLGLTLGPSQIAWSNAGPVVYAAIPGPSAATTTSIGGGGGVALSSEIGVAMSAMIATSHFHYVSTDEFWPVQKSLSKLLVATDTYGYDFGVIADDNHFYYESYSSTLQATSTTWTGNTELCELQGLALLRQDATHLFQLVVVPTGEWHVDVIPKP